MENKIILDASFLIAYIFDKDPHFVVANKVFHEALVKQSLFISNNYLFAEALTMTLIRSKNSFYVKLLNSFLKKHKKIIQIQFIDEILNNEIISLFVAQQKFQSEFLSFADCSLIVQARRKNIKTIFTFDKTFKQFSKEFRVVGL